MQLLQLSHKCHLGYFLNDSMSLINATIYTFIGCRSRYVYVLGRGGQKVGILLPVTSSVCSNCSLLTASIIIVWHVKGSIYSR